MKNEFATIKRNSLVNKALLILLLGNLLASCSTVYKVIPVNHAYSDSINFIVDRVKEDKKIDVASFRVEHRGIWSLNQGYKFISIYMTFENKLNKKQNLNFDTFYLLNPKTKTKHKVELAMITEILRFDAKINSSIEKNDAKQRRLVFIFPEKEKAQYLLVNEKVIEIKYKS